MQQCKLYFLLLRSSEGSGGCVGGGGSGDGDGDGGGGCGSGGSSGSGVMVVAMVVSAVLRVVVVRIVEVQKS